MATSWSQRLGTILRDWHLLPATHKDILINDDPALSAGLHEVLPQLDSDKQTLDQLARDIEKQFLAMGSCVQELVALSSQLLSQSQRLASSSGDEFKTHLQSAFDVINKQLEFVAQYQEINERLITELAGYLDTFQRLGDCQDDLDKILTPMRTVCVLFKIHSVSLENEEKSFFESLTNDIHALQQQARTKFSEQMRGLQTTSETLSANIPKLKEQAHAQREKVALKKQRIEASMQTLQQQFDRMQRCNQHLSTAGQQLHTASNNAVLGLQYQDITRQKWEHVAEAIHQIHEQVDPDEPTHDQLILVRDIGRIQVRQLQSIQSDLSLAQSSVSESVNAMLNQLRSMEAECHAMHASGKGGGAMESMVNELLEALAEARVWVGELSSMAHLTCQTVSSFDKTASDVSGTLRRLSASIGMTALNAQVQVARLGNENGLDVLSEFICTSSTAIKKFSETIGMELDGLVGSLHGTILECRTVEEKTREEQRWLEEQGHQQEEQLKLCRTATQNIQNEVTTSLKKVHDQADTTLSHTDFHATSGDGFTRLQETLQKCTRLADDHLGTSSNDELHSHVHTLKKSYTMESERAVFDAAVAEHKATPRAIAPSVKVDTARTVTPTSAPSPTPTRSVEPAQPATADVKPPAGDFGDNVELF